MTGFRVHSSNANETQLIHKQNVPSPWPWPCLNSVHADTLGHTLMPLWSLEGCCFCSSQVNPNPSTHSLLRLFNLSRADVKGRSQRVHMTEQGQWHEDSCHAVGTSGSSRALWNGDPRDPHGSSRTLSLHFCFHICSLHSLQHLLFACARWKCQKYQVSLVEAMVIQKWK